MTSEYLERTLHEHQAEIASHLRNAHLMNSHDAFRCWYDLYQGCNKHREILSIPRCQALEEQVEKLKKRMDSR